MEQDIKRRLQVLRRGLPRRPQARVPQKKKIGPLGKAIRRRVLVFLGLWAGVSFVLPPFYWPVTAPISSGFLFRLKPDVQAWSLEVHHGIDLAAPRGTPVHDAALGLVGSAGTSPELGRYVRVTHLFGFETVYGHLDRIDVHPGQLVVPGLSTLGLTGNTGRTTGPHLHFGLFWSGLALPPDWFLVFHSLRKAALGF